MLRQRGIEFLIESGISFMPDALEILARYMG